MWGTDFGIELSNLKIVPNAGAETLFLNLFLYKINGTELKVVVQEFLRSYPK